MTSTDKEQHHNYGVVLCQGNTSFGPIYSSIILPIGVTGTPRVKAIKQQGHIQEIDWMRDEFIFLLAGELFLQVSGDGRLGAIVVSFDKS